MTHISRHDLSSREALASAELRRLSRELADLEARAADPLLLASTRACLWSARKALSR